MYTANMDQNHAEDSCEEPLLHAAVAVDYPATYEAVVMLIRDRIVHTSLAGAVLLARYLLETRGTRKTRGQRAVRGLIGSIFR